MMILLKVMCLLLPAGMVEKGRVKKSKYIMINNSEGKGLGVG